jgi:hypothetical protein
MPGLDHQMIRGCGDAGVDDLENVDHEMVGVVDARRIGQLGGSTGDLRVIDEMPGYVSIGGSLGSQRTESTNEQAR